MEQLKQLQEDFFTFRFAQTERIKAEAKKFKEDDSNSKIYHQYTTKYKFLKRKYKYPSLSEVLSWTETQEKFVFDTQTKLLLDLFIAKIKAIFKHGQTMKTELCNRRILSNIKNKKLTIAISKNTLSSKEQWEIRLIECLKKEHPHINLKNMILIISSEMNDLDGNATHCKSVDKAIKLITKKNSEFKLVFMCSNNSRIHNIIEILESYPSTGLPIEIIQDEAHNVEEGIPSKREMIEYIIMHPLVETYIPVSASPGKIFSTDKDDYLWQKENLEYNAIDYSEHCNVISSSENYSSISDANLAYFSHYKIHSSYKDYKIYEYDEETFDEALPVDEYSNKLKWNTQEKIKLDKLRRRQLGYNPFLAGEKEALNIGLNVLDNYYTCTYTEGTETKTGTIILPGEFNLHLITTPLRVAFTITLIKHAIKQSYNPICVGLYRSKIIVWYKNSTNILKKELFGDFEENKGLEMNNKLHQILDELRKKGEDVNRPFLILGNYKQLGESITFVNYKYGTVRSNTLLPSSTQNKETNYQGFLRLNYMDTKFKQVNPSFVHPPKWMIGDEISINDAISYEQENDDRVRSFQDGTHAELVPAERPTEYSSKNSDKDISIPCKLMVTDMEDIHFEEIRKILAKDDRTKADKKKIMNCLRILESRGSLTLSDPTDKFGFNTFTIKEIRTWKEHSEEQRMERANKQYEKGEKNTPFEADYRFREYDAAHRIKSPYINNKSKISVNECDFLAAYDKYTLEDFKYTTNIFWLCYRFDKK